MTYTRQPVTAGQRFGSGVVVTPDAGRNRTGNVLVDLICDCGTQYIARRATLWAGVPKSCGHDRHQRFDGHRLTKLTADEVRAIRKLVAENPRRRIKSQLARQFGVSHTAISKIVRRKTWRHVI